MSASLPRVVALAGGSGSGKSTLARALRARLGEAQTASLPVDAYYHDLSHLEPADREGVNFDHPDALDLDLFATHIAALKSGLSVQMPTYDFTTHCRLSDSVNVAPRPWIIAEGILVAATAQLQALYDDLIFIEADAGVRYSRRLERDQRERGRDEESILRFWRRAEDTFGDWGSQAQRAAKIVISGELPTAEALTVLCDHLGIESVG